MTPSKSLGGLLVLCAFTSLACATVDVETDWDPSVDFGAYATYAWLPEPAQTDHPRDTPLLHARVRAAVDEVLPQRGLRQLRSDPDIRVGYHLSVERRLDYHTVDTYYGYGAHWGPMQTGYLTEYEQGTLIIDIVDTHKKLLVWRGVGSRRLDRNPDPEQARETIRRAVDEILERFPPGRGEE